MIDVLIFVMIVFMVYIFLFKPVKITCFIGQDLSTYLYHCFVLLGLRYHYFAKI